MSNYRNPFRMRASEKIESDSSFLSLYSPIVLDSLLEKDTNNKLWNNILFIHSSPGAGKTSLLRIFQPNSLTTLFNYRSNTNYADLLKSLKKLNVISDNSINLLGVLLSCARNYAVLEDISIELIHKKRLFLALLNARIIMTTLRGICTLKKGKFPEDLKNIDFLYNNEDNYFIDIEVPCNGQVLYNWAKKIEERVYEVLDSFAPLVDIKTKGHNELFSVAVLNPETLSYNGDKICDKFLFMLDDAHKLSSAQRQILKEFLIENRINTNIWIAERIEALEPEENLPLGAYTGRDYNKINIEQYWREHPKKFETILLNIADKRAKLSSELPPGSFQDYLEEELDETQYESKFNISSEKSISTLKNLAKTYNTIKYDFWINYANNFNKTSYEKALLCKSLEIIVNRETKKSQLSFDFPLQEADIKDKINSSVNSTAELFISQQNSIPYYFGLDNLIKISSSNIEQFLSFSAVLFEEILSYNVSKEPLRISSERQEKLIKRSIDEKWKELGKILPYSGAAIKFLTHIGDLANKETYKPNAPYAPGVTGIGIKISKENNLFNKDSWVLDRDYELLVNVLSTCVAYNLIEVYSDVSQGQKGEKWMILYLNRWLCNKFNLPYQYGGWRPKNPDDLLKIIK